MAESWKGELEVGQCYFVRTVTDYWVGRLVAVRPGMVVLEDASWIASTGRLSEFMRQGRNSQMEVEPVGSVAVQYLAYLPWPHALFGEAV